MISKKKPPSLVTDPFRGEKFKAKRRQKFLTAKYFDLNNEYLDSCVPRRESVITRDAGQGKEPVGYYLLFHDALSRLRLHYTAGEPIESLLPLYDDVMHQLWQWHVAFGEYIQHLSVKFAKQMQTDPTAFEFDQLEDFQDAIEVLSIGVLLGASQHVQDFCDWIVSYRRGEGELVIESIAKPAVTDFREEVDTFIHRVPYDPLLDAIYNSDTDEEAAAFVKKYLERWYKAFEGCWWHATHQIQNEDMTPYNGYWSFEAAAVCVIYDIDDSTFRDHIVYPKDLADWARKNNSLGKLKAAADAARAKGMRRMRCEGGQPCPQAGYWFTTAQSNSRRQFEAGVVMPVFPDSPWGATIWYWDEDQTSGR